MTGATAQPRRRPIYQSRQQARGVALISFAIVAVLVGLIAKVLATHVRPGIVERRDIGSAVIAVIAAGAIVVGWRAVRAGVVAGTNDITIRNVFRSIYVPWHEIERFSVEPNGPWTIGCAHLTDGRVVQIWGIQGQSRLLFRNGCWATEPIEQLNDLLAEHK